MSSKFWHTPKIQGYHHLCFMADTSLSINLIYGNWTTDIKRPQSRTKSEKAKLLFDREKCLLRELNLSARMSREDAALAIGSRPLPGHLFTLLIPFPIPHKHQFFYQRSTKMWEKLREHNWTVWSVERDKKHKLLDDRNSSNHLCSGIAAVLYNFLYPVSHQTTFYKNTIAHLFKRSAPAVKRK